MKPFTSVAPGRLCLFGEHQDYLGFPVIALALPLACRIQVSPTTSNGDGSRRRVISLNVPSLNREYRYDLDNLPPRQDPNTTTTNPDFALAALHEAIISDGWEFPNGARCVSESEMPMQAGCSSSSAFVVAWILALAELAGVKRLSPLDLAVKAHRAEVLHFNAPGGTMDHIVSAVGGTLRIMPSQWQYKTLPMSRSQLGVWVLAYSGEPKDTIGHLKRCKTARSELLDKLGESWSSANSDLSEDEKVLLAATRTNRDTEVQAAELWSKAEEESQQGEIATSLGQRLGSLMMQHHEALRDGLGLSTPRLEAMNVAAIGAGAYGFKLVGSGGGGCAVAWTSESKAGEVEAALQRAGAPLTWIIRDSALGAALSYTPGLS